MKQLSKHILITTLIIGTTFGILTSTSQAKRNDILANIIKKHTLLVGTTGDYPPFTMTNVRDNTFRGYSIDVAKELAKYLGVKVKFVPATWTTLSAGVQAHKYDVAISGISITADRLKSVDFAKPHMNAAGLTPVVAKKDLGKYKTWHDLDKKNIRIALQLGTAAEQSARSHFKHATLYSVDSPAIDYTEILAGRADAAIVDSLYFGLTIHKNYPKLALVSSDKPMQSNPFGIMMSKSDTKTLKAKINQWIDLENKKGFFNKLGHKYKFLIH